MKKCRYLHYFLDYQLELLIIKVEGYIVMHEKGENRDADTKTICAETRGGVYDSHEVATEWLDSRSTESAAFQWLYVPDTARRHAARHETRPQAQSGKEESAGSETGYAERLEWRSPGTSKGSILYFDGKSTGIVSTSVRQSVTDSEIHRYTDKLIWLERHWITQQRRSQNRANRKSLEGLSERVFCAQVVRSLVSQGWEVTTEKPTKHGRIDIFASNGHEKRIVEAKVDYRVHVVAAALGQLLIYGSCHPDATLWIATPIAPSEELLSILGLHGVSFYELH